MGQSGEALFQNGVDVNQARRTNCGLVTKVKEAESYYEGSTDLVSIINEKHRFAYANNAFLKAYQYTQLELCNKKFFSVFIGCDISSKSVKHELQEKIFLITQQITSLRKDNSILNVCLKILPIFDENRVICGYEIYASPNPTKEKAEDIFKILLRDLETTYDRFPEIYIEVDEKGDISGLRYTDWRNENYTRSISMKCNIISLFDQNLFNNIIKSIKNIKSEEEIITINTPIIIDSANKYFEMEILSIAYNKYLIVLRDITKIKDRESIIRKTASRFYAVWNHSVDGMRLINRSGKIIAVNPAFCKLVEMSSRDLLGKPFSIIYENNRTPEPHKAIEKIQEILNEKKYESTFEGEVSLSSKKVKYLEIISTIIEPNSDIPLFENDTLIFSIFRDITERKKNEEEILTLSQAVESSGEIIFITDQDGVITYINPAFTKIYGYEKNEIISKVTPRILKSEKTSPDIHKLIWSTLLAGKSMKGEIINKTKSGKELYIEGTADPLLNKKGEVAGYLAIQRDVTERKIAENALMFSESRFRNVWEQSYDGMRLTDENGIMIAVNKAFCKLVGLTEEELINKPFQIIYTMDENEQIKNTKLYKKIFTDKKIQRHRYEYMLLHNGEKVFLNITFSFLELKEDESLLLSIFRDNTQYKKNEEELHKAERLASIGSMTAYLSHEIKNPIAALKNYIEILYDSEYITPDTKETLDLMHEAINHLNKLIKDVLNFSQSKELIEVEIDLRSLIEKVYELLRKKIESQNIHFINSIKESRINGDYLNLLSVFTNLIENSIDAVPKDGRIELYSEENDGYYSIFIKDDGCGIIQKEKIFEPFFTTKSNGTGLGLCIVKKIMDYHKGVINLIVSKPGQTIFELKFKRKAADGENTYNR